MTLICNKKESVFWIQFNRPKQKNSFNFHLYQELLNKLEEADQDNNVVFTILTGSESFYSSGNDFNFMAEKNCKLSTKELLELTKNFVKALINHSKILIAVVNGPAIGIACTTLALFDYIIASENAFFQCPFTEIGLSPEGTSSFTFLTTLGYARASQLLLFGKKISAKTAFNWGFINCLISKNLNFQKEVEKIINDFVCRLTPQSLLASKNLLRNLHQKKILTETNKTEFQLIEKLLSHNETIQRLNKRFLKKTSKI